MGKPATSKGPTTAANSLLGSTWNWCGYHRSHPMVSFDPGGDPYCWVGYWRGEVDECVTVPPLRVQIVEEPADA